jgi:pimeloyl-ACP methyl ester carboxylesterase
MLINNALILASVLLPGLFLYERWSRRRLVSQYPPLGERVEVSEPGAAPSQQMHLHCMGEGKVTVILEDGLGPLGSLSWFQVQPQVSQFAKVCAYDRAGILWSDPSPLPPTAEQIARDLHRALAVANIQPPYVLVGLSMGGIYNRVFAELYPDEVVGMVLVDAAHPDQERRFPPAPKSGAIGVWLTQRSADLGLMRLAHVFNAEAGQRIPAEILPQIRAFFPQSNRAVDAEIQLFSANLQRGKTTPSLGDRPLAVLTAAKLLPLNRYPKGTPVDYPQQEQAIWQELQAELATLSSQSQQVISPESGHLMYFDRPELIVKAIRDIVEAV